MPEYQEQPQDQYAQQDAGYDLNTRLRDLEEKIRLLKDRLLLVGKSVISQREKQFTEIQTLKATTIRITEENARIKELLQRTTELLNNTPRKEDLAIIQRQLDILRK
jgi:predicted S18 family serine protease